jgi:hypothetical protein
VEQAAAVISATLARLRTAYGLTGATRQVAISLNPEIVLAVR